MPSSSSRGLSALGSLLSVLGAAVLMAMMLLTAVDVVCRYAFNRPILGALEITEFMIVVVAFSFLAAMQKDKGHVAVDLLVTRLPSTLARWITAFSLALSLGVTVLLVWASLERGLEVLEVGEHSGILRIPVSPFVFLVALGFAAFGLDLLRDLIALIRGEGERR